MLNIINDARGSGPWCAHVGGPGPGGGWGGATGASVPPPVPRAAGGHAPASTPPVVRGLQSRRVCRWRRRLSRSAGRRLRPGLQSASSPYALAHAPQLACRFPEGVCRSSTQDITCERRRQRGAAAVAHGVVVYPPQRVLASRPRASGRGVCEKLRLAFEMAFEL
jgi:hypothetical protein